MRVVKPQKKRPTRLFFRRVCGFIAPGHRMIPKSGYRFSEKIMRRQDIAARGIMLSKPLVLKIMCVAFVASVVFPLGRMAHPYVAHDIGNLSFGAIQAIFTATLGMGIYAVFFV
jgi:hypothetical protein